MAEQIYIKEFEEIRNTSYYSAESCNDVRNKVLKDVNEFFIKHDGFDIISIIEDWNKDKSYLYLIVYYKDHI